MQNSTDVDIATLIAYHAAGFRVPPSFEVRRHQWRVEAQARFNERGLPRGLRVIA
jgi:hypothetical protein